MTEQLTQSEIERLTERITNHIGDVATLKVFLADHSAIDAATAKAASLEAAIDHTPDLGLRITARTAWADAASALDTLECEAVDKTKLLAETEAELAALNAQLSARSPLVAAVAPLVLDTGRLDTRILA